MTEVWSSCAGTHIASEYAGIAPLFFGHLGGRVRSNEPQQRAHRPAVELPPDDALEVLRRQRIVGQLYPAAQSVMDAEASRAFEDAAESVIDPVGGAGR